MFGKPDLRQPEIDEVVSALNTGWIGTGPRATRFEEQFAAYIGTPHAIAMNSCTAALHLALVAIGLQPGDEVVVPSMTFASTANVVVHAGGTPVLADVKRDTMCLNADDLASRITPRTRAVIPVHFAGRACDMDDIMNVARHHQIRVIEDCAHAVETLYHGHHVGTIGDIGAFSFYATKNVVTGEGGMLTTANPEWVPRIKALRLHGLSGDAWKRFSDDGFKQYEIVEPGFKYNMMDLQAALGLHQLARVEDGLVRRSQVWARYDEAFVHLPVILPTPDAENTRHARHLYTILLDLDRLTADRDTIQAALHRQFIGTGVHFRALHLHQYYREAFGYQRGDLPNAEWISERTLSLPLSSALTEEDVDDVVFAVTHTLEYFTRR
ncbi:MAG: DegT/DnrJ/EryC1/StrS family aminotransferase [Vicinamibacterales bacterium]